MNKTPVSVLQEYVTKKYNSTPKYTFIQDKIVGSNDHEFTIRVEIPGFSVDGKALTKQGAKHNAATAMLLLLNYESEQCFDKSLSATLPASLNSAMETNGTSSTDTGINYIGILHEHCAKKRIELPTFTEIKSSGPSHMMNFTVRCKVGDLVEDGIATTKKLARTEAAKKVWSKLSNKTFGLEEQLSRKIGDLGLKIEDLKMEDTIPNYDKENKLAEQKYSECTKLTKLQNTPLIISEPGNYEECHRVFISSKYSISLRQQILTLLDEINTESESIFQLSKYNCLLDNVARLLNVQLVPLKLESKKSIETKHIFIVGFKLYTNPMIVSIAFADNSALANLKAIIDVTKNLKLLFL